MKINRILIFILILTLNFILFNFYKNIHKQKNTYTNLTTITIKHVKIKVEIANTKTTRIKGLSGRTSLPKNHGMLFIFDKPGFYPFWMKNMNFPIDIIWIDENKKIVDITKNIKPETFPTTYTSKLPVKFVLEVNSGFVNKNNINLGDNLIFNENILR